MNKNLIALAAATLFLIISILFSYSQKSSLEVESAKIAKDIKEVKYTQELKNLWKGKGTKRKVESVINSIVASKIERSNIKRGKADIKLNAMSDKEINRVLTKLAMLPISFKRLQIVRSGDEFILECLCVW